MPADTVNDPVVWIPYEPKELGDLPVGLTCHYWDGTDVYPSDPEEVRFLTGFPGTSRYVSLADVLSRTRNLDVLQVLSSGYDYLLPHLGLLPPGARVCTGRGVHAGPTAELALGLLIASARDIPGFARAQREQRWAPRTLTTLGGKRVLVVGQGSVGTLVADRLDVFGCTVVRMARGSRSVSGTVVHGSDALPDLLPTVDAVVVCAPATDDTYRMFDAAALALLRDGAILVNVARGELVDTDALTAEVAAGRLRAALDVTDPEPLPAGHALWRLPGALMTPHVGAFTDAFEEASRAFLLRQLHHYAQGAPLPNTVLTVPGHVRS
ncbi:NAD(P)-dependent oxidoreductase [Streptomyces seoulensis]